MKRLTKRGVDLEGMIWFVDHENNDISLEPCEMSPHHNRLLLEKVADYEDKEEKGLLIVLPVPLDTPVYRIQKFSGGGRVPNWFQINPVSFSLDLYDEWDETVFETEDKAKDKMAQLQEDANQNFQKRWMKKNIDEKSNDIPYQRNYI